MSTPAVMAALRAGRDAVAAGSPSFYSALPRALPREFEWATLECACDFLREALHAVCDETPLIPRAVDQATRLRAYDLAIAAAGGEVIA